MSNIIKFPKEEKALAISSKLLDTQKKISKDKGKSFFDGVLRFIWITTVLVWPVLKWIVSIEVFFQFIRMLYHWNTPSVYAGWTFLLHFSGLTALTYYVSIYKPKGI